MIPLTQWDPAYGKAKRRNKSRHVFRGIETNAARILMVLAVLITVIPMALRA